MDVHSNRETEFSTISGTWPNIKSVSIRAIVIFFKRLPANLRSNRLWVWWGGVLYIRATIRGFSSKSWSFEEAGLSDVSARLFLRPLLLGKVGRIPSTKVGLLVTELGMFGNMSRRMANGLLLADRLNFGHLVVPDNVIFFRGLFREGVHQTSSNLRVWFGNYPRPATNSISALVTTNLLRSLSLPQTESRDIQNAAWAKLRDLLEPTVPTVGSGPNALTIHVRGGDVFGERKPPNYGQPPLSFYKLVINSNRWENVLLVIQDRSNPVVQGIIDYCNEKNLPIQVQNEHLNEDLTKLLGAQNLVAGRGTFAPAVAGLSPHCKKVFFFEDKCALVPSKPNVEMIRIVDHSGQYRSAILKNNWENSPAQREMMMTYPVSSLAMESLGEESPG